MLTPLPGATPLKPGSATFPMFGVVPIVLDGEGREISEMECSGYLAIKRSWPGQMRTIFGDHERFENTYFTLYDAENKLICDKYYITGDGCRRDKVGRTHLFYICVLWYRKYVFSSIVTSTISLVTAAGVIRLGEHIYSILENTFSVCLYMRTVGERILH